MSTWQFIIGFVSLGVGATILGYCNSTRKKKGPIYSSSYFALSEEDKKYFDKDAEYKRITILYGLIGIFFIFIALSVMTLIKIFAYAALTCIVSALIYSLVKIIQTRNNLKS